MLSLSYVESSYYEIFAITTEAIAAKKSMTNENFKRQLIKGEKGEFSVLVHATSFSS